VSASSSSSNKETAPPPQGVKRTARGSAKKAPSQEEGEEEEEEEEEDDEEEEGGEEDDMEDAAFPARTRSRRAGRNTGFYGETESDDSDGQLPPKMVRRKRLTGPVGVFPERLKSPDEFQAHNLVNLKTKADNDARKARIRLLLSVQNGHAPGYAHEVVTRVTAWQQYRNRIAADVIAAHATQQIADNETWLTEANAELRDTVEKLEGDAERLKVELDLVKHDAAEKLAALAGQEKELARFRAAGGGQATALQEARDTILANDQALTGKDADIDRLQRVNTEQARELARKQEELSGKDRAIAQLSKEARPGVEVLYVDEGVTRIEGEGEGEPAAKRLKATQDSAARSYAKLGGRLRSSLVRVKQVPARGP